MLNLFSKKLSKNFDRIVVSRTDKIGDLILSIPSFYMLRKMFPQSKIMLLVSKYNSGIIKNITFVDEIVAADEFTEVELVKKLRDFEPDLFIALYTNSRVAKLARASRADVRVAPYSKPSSFFSYNFGIKQNRSKSIKNEAQYNLDLIRLVNPQLFDKLYEISGKIIYSKDNSDNIKKFLIDNKISDNFIIVNPFTGGSAKNLTAEEYAKIVAEFSLKNTRRDVVIPSSDNDYEAAQFIKNRALEITRGLSANIFIYKNTQDILDLAALIDKAALYVGASTGPAHIAGNLGKNCLLIYPKKPSQSPVRWGIFGNDNVEYIIVDEDNKNENYKVKTFDKVDDELLKKIATKMAERL